MNVAKAAAREYGLKVALENVLEDQFANALTELLSLYRYENVMKFRKITTR